MSQLLDFTRMLVANDAPHATYDGTSTAFDSHSAVQDETSRTLSPKFALTITVQWPAQVSLGNEQISAKLTEMKRRGFVTVSPKNVYGLENGSIFCFWEDAKNEFIRNVQTFLSKPTTSKRMSQVNVLSITFHESCRAYLSLIAFRSSILSWGKTKSFRFSGLSTAGNGNSLERPTLYERGLDPKTSISKGTKARGRANRPDTKEEIDDTHQLVSTDLLSSSLSSRKRSRILSATNEDSAKRFKLESSPSPNTIHASDKSSGHSSSGESARLRVALSSLQSDFTKERDAHLVDKARMSDTLDKMKLDHDRVVQTEQATVIENKQLKRHIDELGQRMQLLENACTDSTGRISQMQEEMDDIKSCNQSLEKSLRDAQEERRASRVREQELDEALDAATLDLEADRRSRGIAEQKLAESSAVLVAKVQRRIEEEREDLTKKLKAAEDALASERLRRQAAEQTFLDVKCILSGVDIFSDDDHGYKACIGTR